MIKKSPHKSGKIIVSFHTEALPDANSVHLVGSFNGWELTPMKRLKSGRFHKRVFLDPNCRYEYRYLVDGETWINEAKAESYTPNPYGSDNCVVTTFEAESS